MNVWGEEDLSVNSERMGPNGTNCYTTMVPRNTLQQQQPKGIFGLHYKLG
jgi:hypothetical protein